MGRGLAGTATAVITTSGSAVANLLPAAVEAHQADVPLVLLTADRPPALRDTGANQTIVQPGLFGVYSRRSVDLPLAAEEPGADPAAPSDGPDAADTAFDPARRIAHAAVHGAPPGPVHLNAPFEKPLEPDADDLPSPARPRHGSDGPEPVHLAPGDRAKTLDVWLSVRGPRGVIVVGPQRDPGLAAPLFAVAKHLGAPVLADGLSQVRWADASGAVLVGAHDAILADPAARAALRPDWILQLGGLPVSRHLASWVQEHADVPRARSDATGRGWDGMGTPCALVPGDPRRLLEAWQGPGTSRDAARPSDAVDAPDSAWAALWARLEASAWQATEALGGPAEALLTARLLDVPQRGFVGNSLPVRDLDRLALPAPRSWDVVGSRGASGIDGLIATTAGAGALGVIGDMAFRHDVGSLGLLRRRGARLLVIDNGGGRIFDRLGVKDAPLPAGAYEGLFRARGDLDIAAAARAAGLDAVATDLAGVADATQAWRDEDARDDGPRVGGPHGDGPRVVVVETDGDAGHAWRERHLAAVRAAIHPILAKAS